MDIPLGHNIGNSLEVIEAVETLKGNGPQDLTVVCMHLASNMLYLAGKGTLDECKSMVKEVIANGKALEHLAAMVRAQGGDDAVIWDTQKFAKAPYSYEVCREGIWIYYIYGYGELWNRFCNAGSRKRDERQWD